MKRIIQKIKSYSQSIEFTEEEKGDLRNQIVSFMHAHPATLPHERKLYMNGMCTRIMKSVCNPFVFAALFAFITGISITQAAEGTLPGDFLYPVKVYINEPVYAALTPDQGVNWQTIVAEKRLEEIETLIAQGELTDEKSIIVKTYLESALKKAEVHSNPIEFSTILETHAAVITRIDRNHLLQKGTVIDSIDSSRKVIKKKKYMNSAYTNTNVNIDEDIDILLIPTLATAIEKQTIAKTRIDFVNNLLSDLPLDKETKKRVEARTDAALAAYNTGTTALNSGNYVLARDQFIESMTYMQEAKLVASVPKFLGFEEVTTPSANTSTQTQLNEGDVTDDNIKNTDEKEDEKKNNSKAEVSEVHMIKKSQKNTSTSNDTSSVEADVDTSSKVEVSDIQDKVHKLIP